MKRYLIPLALLLLAAAGCTREEGFVIKGDPYFNIVVRNETSIPLAELDEMSARYTLQLGAEAWSAAKNASTHTSRAPRFCVSSNLRWKVVSATGEDYSWVYPFPAEGEKEGIFFFKTRRNIDPLESRTAMFNVLVDMGSGEFEPLEGMLTVIQEPSARFLEMNAAKFNVEAAGQKIRLMITANVPWEYSLTPSTTYGTAGVDWIEDLSEHTSGKEVDTLVFNVLPNDLGVRGADLTVSYSLDGVAHSDVVPITQYPAGEAELEGFPVKWLVQLADNTYSGTWSTSGVIPPVSGNGRMTFHNEAGRAADASGKNALLDISANCPRAQGVWPGDYLEIVASSPVSAGTIVKLVFATRVSATGQKYWRLEFRDGEEWKIVGQSYTNPEVSGPDGLPVVYTHAMESDGSTNIKVESLATYSSNTDQVEFRFICAANYKANDSGALPAPNTGTWRLAVDETVADAVPDDPYQPQISIVAAGAETLTKANLQVTPQYLVFEGTGGSSRKFSVDCDQDFTLTASNDWIHLNSTESGAGNELSFSVSCDDNPQGLVREGTVTVKAGFTRADIAIIQSAAGGTIAPDLDPLISVVGGNSVDVPFQAGSVTVKVQSNVEVAALAEDSWLSVAALPSTKAEVGVKEFSVSYTANSDNVNARQGSVVFYNLSEGLEAVLTVTQERNISGEDLSAKFPIVWSFPAPSDSWKSGVDYLLMTHSDSGTYIYSDDHTGKIEVVRAGTNASLSDPTYLVKTDVTDVGGGKTNERMLLHYGIGPTSYWQFTVENVKQGAGTYNIRYKMCSSAGGAKYFRLEYTLEDDWSNPVPIGATSQAKISMDSDELQAYTYATPSGNTAVQVDQSFTLPAIEEYKTLKIRAIVVSAVNCGQTKDCAVNTTATNRIFGTPTISFTAN